MNHPSDCYTYDITIKDLDDNWLDDIWSHDYHDVDDCPVTLWASDNGYNVDDINATWKCTGRAPCFESCNECKLYEYDFPAYALSALINGDYSGLDPADEKNLNMFLEREGYIEIWTTDPLDEESYFTRRPEFGLSCECVKVLGIVRNK